jgi:hypothetical protein
MVVCIPLGVDVLDHVLNGSLPPLIYLGGQGYTDLVNTSQGIVLGYNSGSFLLYRLALSPTQKSRKQHK